MRLFLDESGDCKCSTSSAYEHFAITVLFVPDSDVDALRQCFKRCSSDMINRGWRKDREVKASSVYNEPGFGRQAVLKIVERLSACAGVGIGYIVVK